MPLQSCVERIQNCLEDCVNSVGYLTSYQAQQIKRSILGINSYVCDLPDCAAKDYLQYHLFKIEDTLATISTIEEED